MNTVYMAWQDSQSRRWFPVGRLVKNDSDYEFTYVNGALHAKDSAGFLEIPGFPKLAKSYRADELFPAFRGRTMNMSRPDRAGYLRQLGLDEAKWDAVTELSISGGQSRADNFEVFPAIEPDRDGRFETRFVLHGMRHVNRHSIERSESLRVGESLRLSFELGNPATEHAILVLSEDYYSLGWLPRYLVYGMHRDNAWMVSEVDVYVAQVNHAAPLSHRVLVDFTGKLPNGFNPMTDLEQFTPIAAA
ncbi:MAG: hypothetical protein OXD31_04345 [Chloroflexi bacterium]|nr:hypothetical protein [Chloroflexota bacterium]